MIMVEGASNVDALESKKLTPGKSKVKNQGTAQTTFNVVCQAGIYVSDEEADVGVCRIITEVDRYTAPSIVFCKVDHSRQQVTVITREEHEELCPEFYEESKARGKMDKKQEKALVDKALLDDIDID